MLFLRLLCLVSLLLFFKEAYGLDEQKFFPAQMEDSFTSFSAYTIGKGSTALLFWGEKVIDPDFTRLALSLEHGLYDGMDILISAPVVSDYDGKDGFQDVGIAIKKRVLIEGPAGPSVAVLVGFTLPGSIDISTGGSIGGALLISKKVGPFMGHLNLAYFEPMDSDADSEVQLSTGLNLAAAHNFNLIFDIVVKKGHYSKKIDLIEGRFGYRVMLSENLTGAVGVGYDFKNREPEWRFFFSLNLLYPALKSNKREM